MTEIKLEELEIDQKLPGKVTRTELYGAFVDIGADKEGMVHISMLKKGNVKRVEDVVEKGQEVEVWIHRVDPAAGRLELTMVQPVELKWKDIKPGMMLQGKVVRLESFGAFVDVGAERPGLVHISELSNDYVKSTGDVVSVDDQVDVRVLDVDRKKRQIRLSMKAGEEAIEAFEDDEPEEELPTAMELALRQAMEQSENVAAAGENGGKAKQGHRNQQEDILSRTLQHRVKTQSSKEK